MQWRFVPFQYYDPYVKTALNDVAISSVQGGGTPVVWLAGWDRDCINVGYTQTVAAEVDVEQVEQADVPIVRRQGAGGTTYLTRDGEITWGMVVPDDVFPDDLNAIYEQVCGTVVDAVARLGIDARYEPINDVVTDSGKISGATARKANGVVYVGGTLLYTVDPEKMFTFLTPDNDKLTDKQIDDFRDRVSAVTQESNATLDETRDALQQTFLDGKKYDESSWTEREMHNAKSLADKYRSNAWIFRNQDEDETDD